MIRQRRHLCFWLLALAAVSLALLGGGLLCFSTFADYDDEGYMMISLRGYQQHGALYDQVFSQYGPAYYQLQSAFHRLTCLPLAHDVARLRTLVFWAMSCGLATLALFRMTRNRLAALAGFLLIFAHLDRLALEPGHPQEWCVLLMAAVWCASTWLDEPSRASLWAAALIGACCGLLAMIKPNLGGLMTCAVIAAVSRRHSAAISECWLRWLSVLALLAIPWVISRSHLHSPAGWSFPLLVTGGLLLLLAAGQAWPVQASGKPGRGAATWWIVLICGLTMAFVAGMARIGGTSSQGLLHGLILQHLEFGSRAFFKSPPLPPFTELILGGLAFVLAWGRRRRQVLLATRAAFWTARSRLCMASLIAAWRDSGWPWPRLPGCWSPTRK
jgi:hypothetical protein